MYIFNPDEKGALAYVHPVKREKLRKLLDADIPEYVDRIYLFGSSLDLSCRTESDIDLYFITKRDYNSVIGELHTLCQNMRTGFDLLVNSYEDFLDESKRINSVESEIAREGLLIYEKEKDITI